MRWVYCIVWMVAVPLSALAQGVNYQEDASVRNRKIGHYYKMVSWNDSQYREFAYYETSQYGSIMDFMNWRAIFPPGYNKNDSKKYPTIVMLHGAGESGRKWTGRFQYESTDPRYDNNGHHLLWGGNEHLQAVNRSPSHSRAFPGIVIFPQVSYNGVWTGNNTAMAALIIEYMIREHNVDPFRIAVHGLSNGAKGVWQFASERPDLFAAGLPMSGVGTDQQAMTDVLVTTPVWIFQGETDTNPSPSWSLQWYNTLKNKGGKPRYTLYAGTGHGTWNKAYAEPDFFSWILQQDKRKIHFFAEVVFQPTTSKPLKLGFSDGYLAYQWTRNGQNISGATGRYYTATTGGKYTVKFKQRINNQWAESHVLDLGGTSGGTNTAIVHIPDVNFKAALVANASINTNGDKEIQLTEANAYTGQVHVAGKGIKDLTGIEAFISLTDLRVQSNQLTSLNLAANSALKELHFQSNRLTDIDLSNNLNLVKVRAQNNQLATLDMSTNTKLRHLEVNSNALSGLNIKNGNNRFMYTFVATGNPLLNCVTVDDVALANSVWASKVDAGVTFSTNCSGSSARMALEGGEDSDLDQLGIAITEPVIYPNPFSSEISIRLPDNVDQAMPLQLYDHTGKHVKTIGYTAGGLHNLQMSDIQKGLYVLKIGRFHVRLIKEE